MHILNKIATFFSSLIIFHYRFNQESTLRRKRGLWLEIIDDNMPNRSRCKVLKREIYRNIATKPGDRSYVADEL